MPTTLCTLPPSPLLVMVQLLGGLLSSRGIFGIREGKGEEEEEAPHLLPPPPLGRPPLGGDLGS